MTTVVNIKKTKDYDIYIGRGSIWGNPYRMDNKSLKERNRVCDLYIEYFWKSGLYKNIHQLKEKILGCYCSPLRCHGDYLAYVVNLSDNEFIDLKNEMLGVNNNEY